MKKPELYSSLVCFSFLAMAFCFPKQGPSPVQGSLVLDFKNYVNDRALVLDSVEYKNELGQTYRISNFKYYISHIRLVSDKGKVVDAATYFLVNQDDPNSGHIVLNKIPAGLYTGIQFTLGVDSLHNCSGAQSGALDPANGMFWAWSTGYIFLKLDGKAPSSTAPGHNFEYHIGGYKSPYNSLREIKLALNPGVWIGDGKQSFIRIKANAAEVLRTPTTIDFSKLPAVTEPKNSKVIADNYTDLFSLMTGHEN